MKRMLAILTMACSIVTGLVGCSHYTDEFAAEPMIIFQLEVVDVTSTTATLVWKTSKQGTSEVYFKRTTSFEDLLVSDLEVLEHRVTLTNLLPQRQYICRVVSRNGDGYYEEWQDIVFTTRPDPGVWPPEPPLP